jgi:GNAT superfamily N-acetyltransferase
LWNGLEYRRRLAEQDAGRLVQAIAWNAVGPVGRGMLLLPGHAEWSISAHRERCAEVRDVYVVQTLRRRGVATAVMAALEREAVARGYPIVGLTVSQRDDGTAARALYERLGYLEAHGPFVASTILETDGGPLPVHVIAMYLVKDASRPPASRHG